MRFSWPENTKFIRLDLEVEDRSCPVCRRRMSICDHRRHSIFTLDGPTQLVCKLVHCPDSRCASRPKTFSPLAETAITMPHWLIGWDVFCWVGYRRFSQRWSIPQLRNELTDRYQISLSHDALGSYIQRYQIPARRDWPRNIVTPTVWSWRSTVCNRRKATKRCMSCAN